jgi:hypothetical protein
MNQENWLAESFLMSSLSHCNQGSSQRRWIAGAWNRRVALTQSGPEPLIDQIASPGADTINYFDLFGQRAVFERFFAPTGKVCAYGKTGALLDLAPGYIWRLGAKLAPSVSLKTAAWSGGFVSACHATEEIGAMVVRSNLGWQLLFWKKTLPELEGFEPRIFRFSFISS